MKFILTLLMGFFCVVWAEEKGNGTTLREIRESLPVIKKQEVIATRNLNAELFSLVYRTKEGKIFELFDMNEEEHMEFAKELISDNDQEKVFLLCKEMMIEVLGLKGKMEEAKFLDVDKKFTRSLVIGFSSLRNSISRTQEEMEALGGICIDAVEKGDKQTKPKILKMYSVMFAINYRLEAKLKRINAYHRFWIFGSPR